MSIQASKPNNKVFLLLGIVLAALAFGGVLFALRQNSAGTSTQSVVVAKKALAAGTTITADLVTTEDLPSNAVPSDAFTVTSAVTGKTTTVAVGANDPIVPGYFAAAPFASQPATTTANGTTSQPVSLETSITKGFVAMAIPAAGELPAGCSAIQSTNVSAELNAAGYYIQAGDHIDVLVLDTPNGCTSGPYTTRFSFQDLPVLRVGANGTSANAAVTSYIVEVSRSQAELLAGLTTGQGKETVLRYVLRPQSEWGKLAADNSSYTPNYVAVGSPSLPAPGDSGVSSSTLDQLFGG